VRPAGGHAARRIHGFRGPMAAFQARNLTLRAWPALRRQAGHHNGPMPLSATPPAGRPVTPPAATPAATSADPPGGPAAGAAATGALARALSRVMPIPVWRAYLWACLPLFLLYAVATETDGVLSRGIDVGSALHGAVRGVGPAILLLIPVWHFCGWMERRGFSAGRSIANHAAMAAIYAVAWHGAVYGMIWAVQGAPSAERARNNWFLWQGLWGMMIYGAAAGGFTAWRAIERARVEAAATAQAQALLARAELSALRNKLDPHFLFNTLHSILALVRRDPPRAEQALLRFSDLLRQLLDTERDSEHSGEDRILLAREIDFTRDYLALESLRLGDRLSVDWRLDDDALDTRVPALCVQPLVENAIKHAFNPRSAPGRLSLSARCIDGALEIDVADDGPGCDPAQAEASRGLGLRTVTRRVQLAGGRLDLHTRPGAGFRVCVRLPVADPHPAVLSGTQSRAPL
jgi:signal transduction histidine kinase